MKKIAVLIMMVVLFGGIAVAQDNSGFEPAGSTTVKKATPTAVKKAAENAPVPADQATGEVTVEEETTEQGEQQKPQSPFDWKFLVIIGGVMVLMIFMSSRAKKKQQKQRQQLLGSLKKGDKVVTIGGICGTIVEARENELVVKVDDNTRMKFARWAVRAAGEEADADKSKDEQEQK